MPRIPRPVFPGVLHHVTQRGNRRENVFFSDGDRAAYLGWLAHYCARFKVLSFRRGRCYAPRPSAGRRRTSTNHQHSWKLCASPLFPLFLYFQSRDSLFSDTLPPGATGEQLIALKVLAFIMPGDDALHSISCAHVLRELMPHAKLSSLKL
jgi:hypothetical protein